MNLAVNARDAMPGCGRLSITTGNTVLDQNQAKAFSDIIPGHYVRLTIADTGTGMTEEVKAHLFEPFFTTKSDGKGTGLGLATCFGIVKQSGGHIEVTSEIGSGTAFAIYFPLVDCPAEVRPDRLEPVEIDGGGETLLVVEDEPSVRELAVLALRNKGYTVLEAANGEEGLRLTREKAGQIDLVLTDVVMPRMGGKEMADAIHREHPETKVLFTSGYTEDAISHHGVLQAGIEFLQKPYMTATLARKVREVLQSPAAELDPARN
jgi:CheY-like chemotaxis protein